MGLALFGFLFLALDVGLQITESMMLELPPDFLGYLMIAFGMRQFREDSKHFANASTFGWMGAGVAGFLFCMKTLSLNEGTTSLWIILELAELVLTILVTYLMIGGIRDQEQEMGLHLSGTIMKWVLVAYGVLLMASYLLQIFVTVGSIVALAADVAAVALFVMFFNAFGSLQDFD